MELWEGSFTYEPCFFAPREIYQKVLDSICISELVLLFQFGTICKSDKCPTALLTWKGGKKLVGVNLRENFRFWMQFSWSKLETNQIWKIHKLASETWPKPGSTCLTNIMSLFFYFPLIFSLNDNGNLLIISTCLERYHIIIVSLRKLNNSTFLSQLYFYKIILYKFHRWEYFKK